MWPDQVSNPGHLAFESDQLPTALRGHTTKMFTLYTDSMRHRSIQVLLFSKLTRHRKRYNPLALYHSSYWSHCWMDTHFLMYLLRVL